MTGTGQRFKDSGYPELKPLIKVNDMCFFEHVVEMFPNVSDILFIISMEEPQRNDLLAKIRESYPHAEVLEIASHKLGPSYAILQAAERISKDKKIILSYCDFCAAFDVREMLHQLEDLDGSILTYTGFHPHMLRNNKYAYVRKQGPLVVDIQEKNPFTLTPMNEEASAGCYGFSNREVLLSALQEQYNGHLTFNGEFYTSLTYKPILQGGGKVGTVLAEQFSQWGTPEDLEDWLYWDACRKHEHLTCKLCRNGSELSMTSLILAAGAGKRITKFSDKSKPNIRVGEMRLWEYSKLLGKRGSTVVISRQEVGVEIPTTEDLSLLNLEGMTEGQAMTAKAGLELIDVENNNPVHIFSSDNVMCAGAIDLAMKEIGVADLVVWTVTSYPPAQYSPENYSWLNLNRNKSVQGITAKSSPIDLKNTPMIIGNFTFKNADLAKKLIRELVLNNIRVNNEFYLDSLVEVALAQGIKVSHFEVSSFFAVGTEFELKIYDYYWKNQGKFSE
jgi:bifunctional N-acetylglucosamine-1-phosphate-uridyltransferase/glucosamine-1-phosphate-acetyltransferase GlmU-like protein